MRESASQAICTLQAPSPALRALEQKIILYQIGPEAWRDLVLIAWARSERADG